MKPNYPNERCNSPLRRVFRAVEHLLAAVGLLFIVYHLGFDLSVIGSSSMAPTLKGTDIGPGDWVLTEKVCYWFRSPHRWEVVTFRNDDGIQVMKRVVGLPGERIALVDGQVTVNQMPVERPTALRQIKYYPFGKLSKGKTAACGEGYFVLGDDSKDSQDSRFDGPINASRLMGRAWLIIWPLSRFGRVGI